MAGWGGFVDKSSGFSGGSMRNEEFDEDVSGVAWERDYHDDKDEDEDDMIPPYERLARKFASSQISSFSLCEGIGRTLKGRDLSKVRNAILTKTGFTE